MVTLWGKTKKESLWGTGKYWGVTEKGHEDAGLMLCVWSCEEGAVWWNAAATSGDNEIEK